jgi:SHAQKYF class myb-like DNA-binding protein
MFLIGLQKLGKGDWRGISRNFVVSRTPTQVASHAQKYFIRQTNSSRRKRQSSLFDMVPEMVCFLSCDTIKTKPFFNSPQKTTKPLFIFFLVTLYIISHPTKKKRATNGLSSQCAFIVITVLPLHLQPMDKSPIAVEQCPHQNKQDDATNSNPLPSLHVGLENEAEFSKQLPNLQSRKHEESDFAEPSLPLADMEMNFSVPFNTPTVPAFYPALVPVPLTLWSPNIPNVEDTAGTAHEILRPTPVKCKEGVKADNVVGMSKLSIGEASSGSMEPTALSLQLIGSMDTRQSAFHASPPRTRPDLSKRNNSPIHAV